MLDGMSLPKIQKAALLFGASDVRVEEIAMEPLGQGEICVRIEATTTCGTDLKTFLRGGHPKIMKSLPARFGHEMAGTIVAIDSSVSKFRVGDRVVVANSAPCTKCFYCQKQKFNLCENIEFINGAYSQYLNVPSRFVQTNVHVIPKQLSFDQATLAEPLACVMHAIENLQVKANETVAVIGTGPMAFLFLQVLKAKEARTILLGRNEERLALAKTHGADHVVHSDLADSTNTIQKLTAGYGADVVIEAVGKPETWQQAVDLVCRGGRVCFYGGCAKGTDVRFDTYRLHYDEITFMGVFHYTPAIMAKAVAILANGHIQTELFISEKRRLEDLSDIYSGKDKSPKALKFLIQPHSK